MKIGLLGYGKMGKTIEGIAVKRGHEITLKVDKDDDLLDLSNVDVAIDFSMPTTAFSNIKTCLENGTPVICGTTGWLDDYPKAVELCNENGGAFLYASNFSLGVNIVFKMNELLAKMMSDLDEYAADIEEIHHTQKLDAPSGTAISLANGIIENSNYDSWTLDQPKGNQLGIIAKRLPDVPGTHIVSYNSEVDTIKIEHIAHSRAGFALGAVIAAEWILDKKGVFNMRDVLNLG
ncbi:4-hydroxy-tetrahydrodipicolinate reductase [Aegicerativicinus sediminis]|uniref:4-hydroxy-tetrahydrodipicolinate reductase n=1 Tax=Aegicerativicinus sediminis TaxID=2893202 RepID=UPI001E5A6E7F|nr:4-hydroxy-tetrahydrodipicolinate reductase [Aegicerativicinus sediminis]